MKKQYGPTLTALKKAMDETPEAFFEWLLDLTDDDARLKAKHRDLIAQYKMSQAGKRQFDIKEAKEFCLKHGLQLRFDF